MILITILLKNAKSRINESGSLIMNIAFVMLESIIVNCW